MQENDAQSRAYRWMINKGYSPAISAGLIGNYVQESGTGLNTRAVGDGGNSIGAGQWNGPRRDGLISFARSQGLDPYELETQLQYMDHEFRTSEKGAWDRISKASSPKEAALAASEAYWRPGDPWNQNRVKYAQDAYSRFTGEPIPQGDGQLSMAAVSQMNDPQMITQPEGYDPSLSPMSLVPQPEDDKYGWLNKLMPNMSTDQRNDRLLAIGTGLLSGSNWSEGLSAAGQGLLALNQSDDNFAQNAQLADLRYRQNVASDNQSGHQYRMIGSVKMPDGSIKDGVWADESSASFFTKDENGGFTELYGAAPLNRSTAANPSGISGSKLNSLQDNVVTGATTLRAYDTLITSLEDRSYGVKGLVDQLRIAAKTATGNADLSDDEIVRMAAEGQLNSMLGRVRLTDLGPGPLTEQDAVRLLSGMGGDIKSFFYNPKAAVEMLKAKAATEYDNYGRQYDQYNAYRESMPEEGAMIELRKYEPKFDYRKNVITQETLPPVDDTMSEDELKWLNP